MLLGLLTDEEELHVGACRKRRAGNGVGAHRHSADRRGTQLGGLRRNELTERRETDRQHDRAL